MLEIGCGNSNLLHDMRSAGYTGTMHGIDYSPTVVAQMAARLPADSGINCAVMDVRLLTEFGDGQFDVVMDKATLDGETAKPSRSCVLSIRPAPPLSAATRSLALLHDCVARMLTGCFCLVAAAAAATFVAVRCSSLGDSRGQRAGAVAGNAGA
eukprot:SAG22_NODE_2339_length_2690_cov_2.159012_3_plen_154_part_00